jgi:hypothetical protein
VDWGERKEKNRLSVASGKMGLDNQKNAKYGEPRKWRPGTQHASENGHNFRKYYFK